MGTTPRAALVVGGDVSGTLHVQQMHPLLMQF
jgi:hypothetical protein